MTTWLPFASQTFRVVRLEYAHQRPAPPALLVPHHPAPDLVWEWYLSTSHVIRIPLPRPWHHHFYGWLSVDERDFVALHALNYTEVTPELSLATQLVAALNRERFLPHRVYWKPPAPKAR